MTDANLEQTVTIFVNIMNNPINMPYRQQIVVLLREEAIWINPLLMKRSKHDANYGTVPTLDGSPPSRKNILSKFLKNPKLLAAFAVALASIYGMNKGIPGLSQAKETLRPVFVNRETNCLYDYYCQGPYPPTEKTIIHYENRSHCLKEVQVCENGKCTTHEEAGCYWLDPVRQVFYIENLKKYTGEVMTETLRKLIYFGRCQVYNAKQPDDVTFEQEQETCIKLDKEVRQLQWDVTKKWWFYIVPSLIGLLVSFAELVYLVSHLKKEWNKPIGENHLVLLV
eukprot:NODE_190_length_13461_cov_0.525595.p5 type:complete len:282 gc:universal NODE_190_length_13461_cov_0.525595:6058-6903(+)